MLARLSRLLLVLSLLPIAWTLFVVCVTWPAIGAVLSVVGLITLARRGQTGLWAYGRARVAGPHDLARWLGAERGLLLGRLLGSRTSLWQRIKALLFWPGRRSAEACRLFFERGRKGGPLVRLAPIHACVISPTGGGKGTSIAIPHLLSSPDSQIVVDIKDAELFLATAALRWKRFRQRSVLLDPYGVLRGKGYESDRFNILDLAPRHDPGLIEFSRMVADAAVIVTGKEHDPHWAESARIISAAICAHIGHFAPASARHLVGVRQVIENAGLLRRAIEDLRSSTALDGLLASMGDQVSHYIDNPKELSSVLTTTLRSWNFMTSAPVMANMRDSTFSPAALREGRGLSIFLALPASCPQSQRSPVLRLWLGVLIHYLVGAARDERRLVHIVGDEMSAVGRLPVLEDACDRGRSAGLRLQIYLQNLQQMTVCFPETYQTVLGNSTQIYFGVNDYQTAEQVSARLGEATIVVASGGSSRSRSYTAQSFGTQPPPGPQISHGSSENWQQQGRRLLKPEEILTLDPRTAITFHPEISAPVMTRLIRHYEREGKAILRGGLFSGFLAAVGMLSRAALMFLSSLLVAYLVTVAALDYERNRPASQPGLQRWR